MPKKKPTQKKPKTIKKPVAKKKAPVTKSVARRVETQKKAKYTASLKLLGRIYTGKGATIIEALANIPATGTRGNISILIVSNGSETREKILNRFQTNRLFTPSRLMREVALKNTAALFNL